MRIKGQSATGEDRSFQTLKFAAYVPLLLSIYLYCTLSKLNPAIHCLQHASQCAVPPESAAVAGHANRKRHDRCRQEWHRNGLTRKNTSFCKNRGREERIARALHSGQRSPRQYFIDPSIAATVDTPCCMRAGIFKVVYFSVCFRRTRVKAIPKEETWFTW